MRQHHPLENPSLAPYGFVFPNWRERLEFQLKEGAWLNAEKVIARVWDRQNRAHALKPLPVQTIIHEIMPSLATRNRIIHGDFEHLGLPYLSRDILVLSSVIQWFGTNVGRCFLETDISQRNIRGYHPEREFLIKFRDEEAMHPPKNMVSFFVHCCSSRCKVARSIFYSGCYYGPNDASDRDREVVNALMHWLGKKAGRAFISDFQRIKRNKMDAIHKIESEKWKLPQTISV